MKTQVNEVYSRFKAGDVTLADEIADKATPQQQEWLARRVAGKAARGLLQSGRSDHGRLGLRNVGCHKSKSGIGRIQCRFYRGTCPGFQIRGFPDSTIYDGGAGWKWQRALGRSRSDRRQPINRIWEFLD